MASSAEPSVPRAVTLPLENAHLDADLRLPAGSRGLVLFAHGSGSGRRSPRNRFVAEALARGQIASLLLDLLTADEAEEDERSSRYRFDIPLLVRRLVRAIDWAEEERSTRGAELGLYGASTGGAAALLAAAERPERVRALVLRGARSDLADDSAPKVAAPVLFLVGELDLPIREANQETARRLGGTHETTVIRGATHLFEEPGALDAVAERTVAWFSHHLAGGRGPAPAPPNA